MDVKVVLRLKNHYLSVIHALIDII